MLNKLSTAILRFIIGSIGMHSIMLFLFVCSYKGFSQSPYVDNIFDDDGQVISEAPENNPIPFIKNWLDQESNFVPFKTFAFMAASPDICFYETKVGEQYGKRFGDDFNELYAPAMRGLKRAGTDPLKFVTGYMKSKGYEVLASVRMGDTHHRKLDINDHFCSMFAIENPQYVIKQPDGRTNETALDYTYPEVREHRFAIMKEIVSEYNVDGLLLDFTRWAKFFPRDEGIKKAPIMTEFVKAIYNMMEDQANKKCRSKLKLVVKIPESVNACWLAGIDIKTWVDNRLVDCVIVSTWNNTDPQLPIEEFTKYTKPAGVKTYAAMGNMIGSFTEGLPIIHNRGYAMSNKHKTKSYRSMLITRDEARAAAANYYSWGADGIYFWNVGIFFGKEDHPSDVRHWYRIKDWTNTVSDPGKLYEGMRWYHYLPMGKGISQYAPPSRNYPWYDEGKSPLGHKNNPVLEFTSDKAGERQIYPFRMADGKNGDPLSGLMEFNIYNSSSKNDYVIDINGEIVNPNLIKTEKIDAMAGVPGLRFIIDLHKCPRFRGNNELGILLKIGSRNDVIPYMEELEIFVR